MIILKLCIPLSQNSRDVFNIQQKMNQKKCNSQKKLGLFITEVQNQSTRIFCQYFIIPTTYFQCFRILEHCFFNCQNSSKIVFNNVIPKDIQLRALDCERAHRNPNVIYESKDMGTRIKPRQKLHSSAIFE